MQKRRIVFVGIAIVAMTIGFGVFGALNFTALAGPPLEATVNFGQEGVGSSANNPNGLARGHDESGEAVDNLVPRTAVISAGGEVLFDNAGGVHQVAIYGDGTSPDDIDIDDKIAIPPFFGGVAKRFIDDDTNRLDKGSVAGDLTFVFDEPGTYLIICTFDGHFVGRDMYGWVRVK